MLNISDNVTLNSGISKADTTFYSQNNVFLFIRESMESGKKIFNQSWKLFIAVKLW